MRAMAGYETRTRRFTRAEYERLIDLGVFQPGEAIELIGGELMVAEPQGAPHYTAISKTAKALETVFGPGWVVRSQGPIRLDDDSEPEPDIAVVPGARTIMLARIPRVRSSLSRWPSRASPSTGSARAVSTRGPACRTTELLNLIDRVLEVYREPAPDSASPFGWR